jgi:hypothetical protein
MKFQSENTALAWSDAKSAALYFDRVFPVRIEELQYLDEKDPIFYKTLQKLLPESLTNSKTPTGLAEAVTHYVADYFYIFPEAFGVANPAASVEDRERHVPEMTTSFSKLLQASGVTDFAVYGEKLIPVSGTSNADPCLILSELSLIDTNRLSWRHVLEFREDVDSVAKLRRLRRFIYETYDGKPESFIKEDIEERIEKYNETTRLWGFPLAKGLLEISLTGEVAAAVGAVLGMVVFGAPLAVAAAAGGTIAIGKAALTVAQRKREIELEKERNPVAYIAAIRSRAE